MISRLEKFIPISSNVILDSSKYGKLVSILSCNENIPTIRKLGEVFNDSIGRKDFPLIMNSILEHIESNYIIEEFIVRKRTVSQAKRKADPNRSRIAKMSWKKNKMRMLKGLRKFHKSTEGKSFHKALGKFASKSVSKSESSDNLDDILLELNELRISISSAITFMCIDMKTNPDNYLDFPNDDFYKLMDAYSEVMKDMQDAWVSRDLEIISDTIQEVIYEFASVLIGLEMDYIYLDNDLNLEQ